MIARRFNHTWTEARKMKRYPNRLCTDSHPDLSSPRICQLVSRAILPLGERRSAIPERRTMNVEKGVRAKSRLASSNENLQTSATSLKWAQAFARPQGSVVTRCKFHTRAGSPVRGRHGRRFLYHDTILVGAVVSAVCRSSPCTRFHRAASSSLDHHSS